MPKIMITGKTGYLANHLKLYIDKVFNRQYITELLDLRDDRWINRSFADVACIVHTAALVHKNEDNHDLEEYLKVNRDLTKALAEKAKNEGVNHFVFISTMAVYGVNISCFKKIVINSSTPCQPQTKYGISKYEAEQALKAMDSDNFAVAIVRPPFIYGEGCPGNYNSLKKQTLDMGIIPKINNMKSMIYIDNLCEFISRIISRRRSGTFCPQNESVIRTCDLAMLIAANNGKKAICSILFNPFVYLASLVISPIRKAFGNEYYDINFSNAVISDYTVVKFEDSVRLTEHKIKL